MQSIMHDPNHKVQDVLVKQFLLKLRITAQTEQNVDLDVLNSQVSTMSLADLTDVEAALQMHDDDLPGDVVQTSKQDAQQ